jgi:hypothetical protein
MLAEVWGFRGDDLLVGTCFLAGILGVIVVAVTKLVADYARKSRRDDMEATLKMEMIQRGMSADEIKQVLEARIGSSRPKWVGEFFSGLSPMCMPKAVREEAKNS